MAYWTLTTECLELLCKNWVRYYNDRVDCLNRLYKRSADMYRAEGDDDIRRGRYTRSSVQDWYDGKMRDLNRWYDDCISDLKNEDAKFERLVKTAAADYYDSSDYGYKIVYDFHRFEKRRERTSDTTTFTVSFAGQTHWYSSCGRREDFEFVTGKPYFVKHG